SYLHHTEAAVAQAARHGGSAVLMRATSAGAVEVCRTAALYVLHTTPSGPPPPVGVGGKTGGWGAR
ncbi:DUF1015 domain-containing protein, partial [Streptomyces noursei]